MSDVRVDVAVVGGGPSGIAAATRAAERGARVAVIDEGLALGGQIWRRRAGAHDERRGISAAWLARLARSGAGVHSRALVYDARPADDGCVLRVQRGSEAYAVRCDRVIVATGARERFLPFPGWTLPNVFGIGGAQALLKAGAPFRDRRVVIAGSGPLLMPVAASLSAAGARVVLVAEQASAASVASFATSLVWRPDILLQAMRYRAAFSRAPYLTGTWVARAKGTTAVASVVLTDRRGREREVECDALCTGYGLLPNTELARLLGCATNSGAVSVDAHQRTSVPRLYSAGEPNGIGGVECAIVEGEIAGLCAVGRDRDAEPLLGAREAARRDADRLAQAFTLREELCRLAMPDTIVCRCEDVAYGAISADWNPRQAKLYTRVGMGPCQGRICGGALQHLFGWEPDVVRPPLEPVPVSAFLSRAAPTPSDAHGAP